MRPCRMRSSSCVFGMCLPVSQYRAAPPEQAGRQFPTNHRTVPDVQPWGFALGQTHAATMTLTRKARVAGICWSPVPAARPSSHLSLNTPASAHAIDRLRCVPEVLGDLARHHRAACGRAAAPRHPLPDLPHHAPRSCGLVRRPARTGPSEPTRPVPAGCPTAAKPVRDPERPGGVPETGARALSRGARPWAMARNRSSSIGLTICAVEAHGRLAGPSPPLHPVVQVEGVGGSIPIKAGLGEGPVHDAPGRPAAPRRRTLPPGPPPRPPRWRTCASAPAARSALGSQGVSRTRPR